MHYLRLEISEQMASELKAGADWRIGVQHPVYSYEVTVDGETRASLLNDLD